MKSESFELLQVSGAGSICDIALLIASDGSLVHRPGLPGGVYPAVAHAPEYRQPWRTVYDIFESADAEQFGELLESGRMDSEMHLMKMRDGRDVAVSLRVFDVGLFLVQCFSARQWRDLLERESQSRNMVYSMMENVSEQGALLMFFREAVHCSDIAQFLELFFQSIARFGLTSLVSVHHRNYSEVLRQDGGKPTSCELRLLDACRSCDKKIFCAGPRSLFRGRNISFVIKNMPENVENAGRLRDHLAILLDGADAIIDQILLDSAESSRKELALLGALTNNERMLKLLDQEFDRQNRSIMGAINTIIGKMYSEFCYLHLTDSEEDKLIAIINEGIAPLTEVVTSTVTLQRVIRASIDQLKRAVLPPGRQAS